MKIWTILKEYMLSHGVNKLYNEDYGCECNIKSVFPKNCLCGDCKIKYMEDISTRDFLLTSADYLGVEFKVCPGQFINILI